MVVKDEVRVGLKEAKDYVDQFDVNKRINTKDEIFTMLKKVAKLTEATGEFDDFFRGENIDSNEKVGRNDPCICGSEKKYKKCCLNKKKLYTFKVHPRNRKSVWRRVQLIGNNTLWDFDKIIKNEFKLDPWDHLSEFFSGKAFNSLGFGSIYPDKSGQGENVLIKNLNKKIEDTFEYVYDFGSSFYLTIIVENIEVLDSDTNQYPLVFERNKPRYKKCLDCGETATWICIQCNDSPTSKSGLYCEKCMENHDEEHYLEELFY